MPSVQDKSGCSLTLIVGKNARGVSQVQCRCQWRMQLIHVVHLMCSVLIIVTGYMVHDSLHGVVTGVTCSPGVLGPKKPSKPTVTGCEGSRLFTKAAVASIQADTLQRQSQQQKEQQASAWPLAANLYSRRQKKSRHFTRLTLLNVCFCPDNVHVLFQTAQCPSSATLWCCWQSPNHP